MAASSAFCLQSSCSLLSARRVQDIVVFTVVIRPCQNDITVLANEEIAQPLIELLIEGVLTQSNSKIASSRIHAIINVDDKWHRINAHASLQRSAEMQVHKQSTDSKNNTTPTDTAKVLMLPCSTFSYTRSLSSLLTERLGQ